MVRKVILFCLLVFILSLTIYAAYISNNYSSTTLMDAVLERYKDTGALNAVTAVYLDYRVFDTLFETFLLLVSVLGLSQFLRLEQTERIHMEAETSDDYQPSTIASSALHLILPLFVIFGLYVTAFGPNSPGGGFQGGAILAALVMVSYLSNRKISTSLLVFTALEEIFYILFLLVIGIYFILYTQTNSIHRVIYMALTNFIICFKVYMGFIVIFLRMIGQSQHRTLGDAYE